MQNRRDCQTGPGAAGYTLIELVVVCAVLATILVLAAPSLRPERFDDPLTSASRRLVWLVQEARAEARLARQPYLLQFDQADRRFRYRLEAAADGETAGAGDKASLVLPPSVRLAGLRLGEEELVQLAAPEVWISGRGYLEEMRIALEDENGQRLVLTFSPFHEAVAVAEEPLAGKG
jgi:type II secretion system protein H